MEVREEPYKEIGINYHETNEIYGNLVEKKSIPIFRRENSQPINFAETKWAEGHKKLLECKTLGEKLRLLSKMRKQMQPVVTRISKEIIDENHYKWSRLLEGANKIPEGTYRSLSQERELKYVPLDVGGVAGGHKFMAEGFLFKLAVDPKLAENCYLYGGDKPFLDRAAKAASQELHGANQFYFYFLHCGIPIQVPWQTIVDYRGFRIVAMPILPLADSELIYGSNDAGKTVKNSDAKFSEWMKAACAMNHLAEHKVRNVMLCTGGDVEGHKVVDEETKQSSLYLLDLARWAPPEHPEVTAHLPHPPSGRFYRLMRGEFLQKSLKRSDIPPLSSDTLTGWGAWQKSEHETNLRKATRLMCLEAVDSATFDIVTQINDVDLLTHVPMDMDTYTLNFPDVVDVATVCHRAGLPIRHIILVLFKLVEEEEELAKMQQHQSDIDTRSTMSTRAALHMVTSRIVGEMISRCLKHRMKKDVLRQSTLPKLPEAITKFLNTLFGPTSTGEQSMTPTDHFWKKTLARDMCNRFGMTRFLMSDEMWRKIATETTEELRSPKPSKVLKETFARRSERNPRGLYVHETTQGLYAHEISKIQARQLGFSKPFHKALSGIYHIYNDVPEATIEAANPCWIHSQMRIANWVSREREISQNFFNVLKIRSESFHRQVPKMSKEVTRENHYEVIQSLASSLPALSNDSESLYEITQRRAFTAHLGRFLSPGRFDWSRLYVEDTKSWWAAEDMDEKAKMPPLLLFTRRHLIQVVATTFEDAGMNITAGAWSKLAQWVDDEKKSNGASRLAFEIKDAQPNSTDETGEKSLLNVRCTQMDIMAWGSLNAAVTELVGIMEKMEKVDESKLKKSSDNSVSLRHEDTNTLWKTKIRELMALASKNIKVLQRSGGSCGASEAIFISHLNLHRFVDAPWMNDSSVSFVHSLRRFERSFRRAMDIKRGSLTLAFALCGTGMTVFKFIRMVFEKIARERPVFDLAKCQKLQSFPSTLAFYGGKIRNLDLSGNLLENLNEDIGHLEYLKELDVSDNQITDIDAAIGKLGALEVFNCSRNRLKKLPKEIGGMKSLRVLDLQNNDLKELPASMKNLSSLEVINVSGNDLDTRYVRTILADNHGLKIINKNGRIPETVSG